MSRLLVHVDASHNSLQLNVFLLANASLYRTVKIANTNSFYVYGSESDLEKLEKILTINFNLTTVLRDKAENQNRFKNCISSYMLKTEVMASAKVEPNYYPYYFSNQIGKIYGLVPKNTVRTLIGVIELGGGFLQSDLTAYWSDIGLTTTVPIVRAILIDGATNNISDINSSVEVALDIQNIGGICPNSTINVYFAPNTDQGFYDAIAHAISDGCKTISISWAGPESQWSSQELTTYNNLLALAVSRGITICVASGDSSSSNGTASIIINFPSTIPNVLCCGGTKLICPDLVYDAKTSETVWYDNPTEGTTGGYSSAFLVPAYQKNNIVGYTNLHRGVPDVSGNAEPSTGWIIMLKGQLYVVGGTSAVAPLWAAYLASINCNTFANNLIYPLKGRGFHDITVGNDGLFRASVGWDACTGWGSPNGTILTPYL